MALNPKTNILALQELADLIVITAICYHVLQCYEGIESQFNEAVQAMIDDLNKAMRRTCYAKRTNLPRRLFSELLDCINDTLFRRMFRMKKSWFITLTQKIEEKVSPAIFKSEKYLASQVSRTHAATATVGGFISGEIKLALTIRMLAGASYLDLMMVYGITSTSIYRSFHECIGWINETFTFPLSAWLRTCDTAALRDVSNGFAERSDGAFSGCIGALDGIAIRIDCPTLAEDENPGQYFCRKGFFALNAQCICDSRKKILWISTGHIGSSHDSSAFTSTALFDYLEEISDFLYENGFFIAGDSAYPLM